MATSMKATAFSIGTSFWIDKPGLRMNPLRDAPGVVVCHRVKHELAFAGHGGF